MSTDDIPSNDSAIAVIGMAGRFPGARDVASFWRNLRDGVESIRRFTDDELRAAGESEENLRDPAYVKACPQLEGVDQFDAAFFNMSPRDAAAFDPQHRFFLEIAWEAFEHAGYVGERIEGPVSVFASCGLCEYMMKNVLTNPEVVAQMGEWLIRHTGNDTNFLATRVSYELNLRGPSMNVQTACSSTLVAIHLACQSLLNRECDVALAGGAVISPEQNKGYFYKEGEILSPDGHCRTFDAKAHGTLISSAAGAVVLKRLSDALADGDHVLAVIRGSAINNDGNDKVGYLAPSVSGQARVVAEALAISGVDARDVSYVEAHGTATLIGDPIEIAGLTQAYRESTEDKQFCAIGSLKSNIGHTGEAAGIASFIKTVLSLQNREIPPSLHYESPNPQCFFPSSPFYVNASLRPWTVRPGKTRIAGITGLGAGGTNAHVIVEEAPPRPSSARGRGVQLLTLSARTKTALDAATKRLADHLREHPDANLADVAYTLLEGRKPFNHRRALAVSSVSEAVQALDKLDARVATQHHKQKPPSVVFMFPGGGAQYAGMGQRLYEQEPVYRQAIDECATFINPRLGRDLRTIMYPPRGATPAQIEAASAELERPSLALPAMFATEYAMAKLLESWGIKPAAMIGHSAGEYAAACLSGVLTMHDAMALVALRGRLFETVPRGGMLSVPLPEAEVRKRMPEGLSIAAINADALCVASGPVALIAELEAKLVADEIECTRVRIDVAAHSSMLDPILAELGAFCRTMRFSAPQIPYMSNLTGTWVTEAQAKDPNYWVRHLREAVRFGDGINELLRDPNRVLLEVGPGRTLSSLARHATAKAQAIVSTLRHPKEEADDLAFLLGTVGRVWAAGVDLEAKDLHAGEKRQRVALPTYPFERQRYWIDPVKPSQKAVSDTAPLRKRADVASWFYTPSWHRAPTPRSDRAAEGPASWLFIVERARLAEQLVQRLRARGDSVTIVELSDRFADRGAQGFTVNPAVRTDWDALFDTLRARGGVPRRIVHAVSLGLPPFRNPLKRRSAELEQAERTLSHDYMSLIHLAQELVDEADPVRLSVLTTGVCSVAFEPTLVPARATLHGACRVIPRELSHVQSVAIDLDVPTSAHAEERLLDRLVAELDAPIEHEAVALRSGERWLRTYDPIRLDPSRTEKWAREDGVYLITGGLGGIGLAMAEHLARTVKPTLVLIARSKLPDEAEWDALLAKHAEGSYDATREKIRRVKGLRALGAEVILASADVTDRKAMEELVKRVRVEHGPIRGVIHSAGVLRDVLLANRTGGVSNDVIDTKVKGTLVLDAVLESAPPDVFVMFSSISSMLGLPGQADYTAANAFLDAYAHQKAAHGPTRYVSINWNAWQEVGMVAEATREARSSATRGKDAHLPPPIAVQGSATPLFERAAREGETTRFATELSRARHWLLGEHVVRGGDALIPGTGFVELSRQAAALGEDAGRIVEIRDLFFLAPFVVAPDEVRTLRAKLDRASHELLFYSDSETQPHATARVSTLSPVPRARHDLGAIRARCSAQTLTLDGNLPQPFMDFGPRWANVRRVDYGQGEALISLELPARFAAELDTYAIHPALLDMATGGAQGLIPNFDQQRTFYVPFSYGRVLVHAPLTPKLYSHVRYRAGGTKDLAVFDIVLCDEQGNELVGIEGFAMRLVARDAEIVSKRAPSKPAHEAPVHAAQPETPLERALKEGILPSEGADALDRILGAQVAPQLVACSVDLHRFIAQTDRDAKAITGEDGASGQAAPQFERPNLGSEFVEPRTPIERELAKVWGELLGVENIGAQDDFFELGGQSLIAVRLFARLRKKYGIELPLSTLFEAPTIAACANVIAERLGVPNTEQAEEPAPPAASATPAKAAAAAFRSLVVVQRGSEGAPFFCVHGAGGNVLNFRDLARAMPRTQTFYGLQARGVDGQQLPHGAIEEMAASYLDEVRGIQPHGPYLLGGYSGGGVVAYEMAQQLGRAGEEVALLVLLDTYHPQMPLRRLTLKHRLKRLREERFDYVRSALEGRFVHLPRFERERAQIAEHVRRGDVMPPELRDRHLTENFERVAAAYRPKPWSGEATLLRARDVPYIYQDGGYAYGWDAIMRVNVVEVPGNHNNLLLEPNATVLVRSLNSVLENAQRKIALARADRSVGLGQTGS